MMDHWLTPWRTALALQAAYLETLLSLQKSMVGLNPALPADAEKMRDAFRAAADANVRRWTGAADALKSLPNMYHAPFTYPGTMMTDAFDRFQPHRRR